MVAGICGFGHPSMFSPSSLKNSHLNLGPRLFLSSTMSCGHILLATDVGV